MKIYFSVLLISILFINYNTEAQCLSSSGDGTFDNTSNYNQWVKMAGSGGVDYGIFTYETEEKYLGSGALKAQVTQQASWQMRMVSSANCPQTVEANKNYKVVFALKGPERGTVNVTLDYPSGGTDLLKTVEANTEWTKHSVVFTPTEATTELRIKIAFVDVGTYYIDEITFGSANVDCHGDADGTAFIDDCGICAGGNTNIVPNSLCPVQFITPDDANIQYQGALFKNINNSSAELYRFTQDYIAGETYTKLDQFYGPHQAKGSRTQSGISIEFTTNSAFVFMHFETLEHSLENGIRFTVFKNDEIYMDNISSLDFIITNEQETLADYKVYLPSLHGVKFIGMDIDETSSLSLLDEDTRPTYMAIGNSITHGVGQDNASHLTYPVLVGQQLDYKVYNLGISGSRINEEVFRNLAGIEGGPDLLTVLWGYNNLKDDIALATQLEEYQRLMTQILINYPDTEVYAIMQSYTSTVSMNHENNSNSVADLRSLMQNIIVDLQSQYSNLKLIDAWDYTDAEGLNDAVHLNTNGAQTLADGIVDAILKNKATNVNEEIETQKGLNCKYNSNTKTLDINKEGDYLIYSINGQLITSGYSLGSVNLSSIPLGIYILKLDKLMCKFIAH
ncbi:SGNH/GDSL hydrolase family protein [Carboxylicivirga sp. M1479]|uniref:SGNH/GDSL hydrolase family protein n=1 Tax=Carboxylicivirga sp. M1479 TaxID=2594476 RepID=UPI001178CD24|nr:SGNH/GDSL hydrolase family protein [Carboxylicivirga sp. M1479]TRX71780.1 SGNH/GDSL hydrolase family protein [Carboxylicivirga sp. M1479]